ncbi:hypothetical protein BDZ89DRAFT_1050325 [Hymenopellis radicata]|nr:hypothetical protein BDZ89DRAFT_1050325 [Hymenopellis radicata]
MPLFLMKVNSPYPHSHPAQPPPELCIPNGNDATLKLEPSCSPDLELDGDKISTAFSVNFGVQFRARNKRSTYHLGNYERLESLNRREVEIQRQEMASSKPIARYSTPHPSLQLQPSLRHTSNSNHAVNGIVPSEFRGTGIYKSMGHSGSTPSSESPWQRHTSKSNLSASDFDPLRLEGDPDLLNSVVKSAVVMPEKNMTAQQRPPSPYTSSPPVAPPEDGAVARRVIQINEVPSRDRAIRGSSSVLLRSGGSSFYSASEDRTKLTKPEGLRVHNRTIESMKPATFVGTSADVQKAGPVYE